MSRGKSANKIHVEFANNTVALFYNEWDYFLPMCAALQARKWFKLDYGVHQKWMGGMKLGTLVYEKSGKSKSSIGPLVGTIRLKVPGTYKGGK